MSDNDTQPIWWPIPPLTTVIASGEFIEPAYERRQVFPPANPARD